MTAQEPQFDDLDPRVAHWLANEARPASSEEIPWQHVAEWADHPCDTPTVESLLCDDADARAAVIDLRLGRMTPTEHLDPALLRALIALQTPRPAIAGRIGRWSMAAAAAVLLATTGYWLGSQTPTSTVDQDTLVASVLGMDLNQSDAMIYELAFDISEMSGP